MEPPIIDKCAACGKEGDNLKACTACHMVKYCNRDCQIAHRPQHKKECRKRAAELYDEKLFKEVEPDECPICLMPLSLDTAESSFKTCCGKSICIGCVFTMTNKDLCAFCRTPPPTSEEEQISRIKKLMESGNGKAYYNLAGAYSAGTNLLSRDDQKAHDLWQKAGDLGCAGGYYNLGVMYLNGGDGVNVDKKKAQHYFERAVMCGSLQARHALAKMERESGNYQRAYKHCIIAARAGYKDALDVVKRGFLMGMVTKDEYENTLRSYQQRQDEMKSNARDEAAKFYRGRTHSIL